MFTWLFPDSTQNRFAFFTSLVVACLRLCAGALLGIIQPQNPESKIQNPEPLSHKQARTKNLLLGASAWLAEATRDLVLTEEHGRANKTKMLWIFHAKLIQNPDSGDILAQYQQMPPLPQKNEKLDITLQIADYNFEGDLWKRSFVFDNEGKLCVEESFDTKMMMMARKVKQRRSKQGLRWWWWWWWFWWWSKDGASKVYGRQDSPEIKIELPPPGIPSLPA